ncbi:MAG TPA: hypothetical protein VG387_20930 [Rhizomicrobium sp.]|jgi:beta-lactamase superfamily II metal-dependent hydrolase|nr:hypothetical protein [Rhizomicrobium sp.]
MTITKKAKAKKTATNAKAVKAPKTAAKKKAVPAATTPDPAPAPRAVTSGAGIRVRMYRVGFGDFFLVRVPSADGDKFILIDCGVHHVDIKSMPAAAQQMAQDCGNKLALLIMTHRHADHISGFGSCAAIFKQFEVERVWMSWFEEPTNKAAMAFQAGLTASALRAGQALTLRLAAKGGVDDETEQLLAMAQNATGGMAAAGGTTPNQTALNVLHGGFKNKPAYDYYIAGDTPALPDSLIAAGLTAQIIGPPSDLTLVKQMTNKAQQYLDADRSDDDAPAPPRPPFPAAFRAAADAYPPQAFHFYDAARIVQLIDEVQPDLLAAQARAADSTLNNQSLMVHFAFAGKNLLFVGDAQWGNWENFLYGGAYSAGRTALTAKAKALLGAIDFYKVGHHGSANATPIDAVKAMRDGCAGMCSTQIDAYPGVPRGPLLTALSTMMHGQLARSDQVAAGDAQAEPTADRLPAAFKSGPNGTLYIDYSL